jgi:hypothetical protein
MKRFAVLIFLMIAAAAPAQGGSELGLGLGWAIPTGDMTDEATSGPQFGARYGFTVAPRFVLGLEVFYTRFGLSRQMEDFIDATLGPGGDLDLSITQSTLSARIHTRPGNQGLYAKLLAGMYRSGATTSLDDMKVTVSQTDFGLGVGAGFEFAGSGATGWFVEGLFHSIFPEEGSGHYFDLRGGVTFRFL